MSKKKQPAVEQETVQPLVEGVNNIATKPIVNNPEGADKPADEDEPLVLPEGEKPAADLPVVAEQPLTPDVVQEAAPDAKPPMNSIVVSFTQDFIKESVSKKTGVTKQTHVKHKFEVSTKTARCIESDKLSDFLVAQLAKYQLLQQAQGRAKFDTAKPIEMSITVNDREVETGIKISTNAKALERILNQYPTVVSTVFNPKAFEYGSSRSGILNMVQGMKTLIAPEPVALAVTAGGQLQEA